MGCCLYKCMQRSWFVKSTPASNNDWYKVITCNLVCMCLYIHLQFCWLWGWEQSPAHEYVADRTWEGVWSSLLHINSVLLSRVSRVIKLSSKDTSWGPLTHLPHLPPPLVVACLIISLLISASRLSPHPLLFQLNFTVSMTVNPLLHNKCLSVPGLRLLMSTLSIPSLTFHFS